MDLYLALDIGTSSTKCSIIDDDGHVLSKNSCSYIPLNPKPNWIEQDPNVWWSAVRMLSSQVLERIDNKHLKAITVTGQTPSCVPIDKSGNPITNAILWLDRRASECLNQINTIIDNNLSPSHELGNRIDGYFGGVKWIWFMLRRPELFLKTWKILQANSYITYKLTNQIAIDQTQASLCTPFYDFSSLQWDFDLCQAMGFPVEKLPDIRKSDEIIGHITHEAAEQTGLPKNTPVLCGAADFSLACLGTGVHDDNTASIMLGTAGNLMMPRAAKTDARLINSIHVTGEKLVFGGVLAGRNISWFLDLLNLQAEDTLEILTKRASELETDTKGPIYLPYLDGERTPIWDPAAKGVFFGIASHHKQEHLFRAILEGTAFALRMISDIFTTMETPIRSAVVVDGGSKNNLWMKIISDVLQVPILTGSENSNTQLGAAFLGALALGNKKDYSNINEWLEPGITTYPNPKTNVFYSERFIVYRKLYQNVKDLFPDLE